MNETLIEEEVAVDVIPIPRMASVRLAIGAVRFPIKLFAIATVVPADIKTPLTQGDVVETALLTPRS